MQDSLSSSGFYTLAKGEGWDFHTVWAPPNNTAAQSSDGLLHYAELYALSHVSSIEIDNQTKTLWRRQPDLDVDHLRSEDRGFCRRTH